MLSKYLSSNFLFAYRRLPFLTTYVHFGWFSSSRTVFSPHPVYAIISDTLRSAFSHIFTHSLILFPFLIKLKKTFLNQNGRTSKSVTGIKSSSIFSSQSASNSLLTCSTKVLIMPISYSNSNMPSYKYGFNFSRLR